MREVECNEIVVVNGLYYTGLDEELSTNRSDAKIMTHKSAVCFAIDDILRRVVFSGFNLKRIEMIKPKEVLPDATL